MRTNISLLLLLLLSATIAAQSKNPQTQWPILKHYDQHHLAQIALPVGGIGTGTISIGGRGDLRDWEIVNRPAKGFNPGAPFFAIWIKGLSGKPVVRALQGPVELSRYEGMSGVKLATNPNLPCFRNASFDAAYPFGIVNLSDPTLPVTVKLKAFNPLVPTDVASSEIPIAVLTYEVTNTTSRELTVAVSGSMMNFIGNDGVKSLASKNINTFRNDQTVQGIYMTSDGVAKEAEQYGTIALTTSSQANVSYRTSWLPESWGSSILDYWDDFSDDGKIQKRISTSATPRASLSSSANIPPKSTREFTFYITWHFPNRFAWSPSRVGNYYTTQYRDAWDVALKTVPHLEQLENSTIEFVSAFLRSKLPESVKEAALFNLSTLRTQTCFRTEDGRFYAWEGCNDTEGCCWGSCTHVWNYEQAIAFLFGDIAQALRKVEFGSQTDTTGLMSFRVRLPFDANPWGKAAADGQMGCIIKMYRDWQLSGDNLFLRSLWPNVKRAVEFCWIRGGWDADMDGVMEGCQHNTMDVEYYGPNPQMGIWYLGALRAAEEMARAAGDERFATVCHTLFANGSKWIDANLFNGEYYIHKIVPPKSKADIAPSLLVGMGAKDITKPDYQLGEACLVDQLIGQTLAHVSGLGYLVKPENVRTTLKSIMKYNYKTSLFDHFNCLRTFALGDEAALLMASYPKTRPVNPFPYFTEVMTGFEYTAAIGMLYEGDTKNGLTSIQSIRNRYDGLKRSPFDEAECGHHYGRAMISWGSVLALTGFHYSGVTKTLTFAPNDGEYFWSNGYAYGTVKQQRSGSARTLNVSVIRGSLSFHTAILSGFGKQMFRGVKSLQPGQSLSIEIPADDSKAGLPKYPVTSDGPEIIKPIHIGSSAQEMEGKHLFLNRTSATARCETPGVELRYTIDGSEPMKSSLLYSSPIEITQRTQLRVKAYKNGMESLRDSKADFVLATLRSPVKVDGLVPGIQYWYYEGSFNSCLDLKKVMVKKEGTASKFDITNRMKEDDFAFRFEGFISIPIDGIYSFSTESDDGSMLYIGDEHVVNNDGVHALQEMDGAIALAAGMHPITVLFFERGAFEILKVFIGGPEMEKQEITAGMLFRMQ